MAQSRASSTVVRPLAAPTLLLSVLVVNHKSWPDVARLADGFARAPELGSGLAELVVVDNGSNEPVPASLRSARPGIPAAILTDNGGFSAGVNTAWRASRGRWLLLLNPDVLAGPELIGRVLDRIHQLEGQAGPSAGRPGIVGFALKNPDGTIQPSVGAEPGLARLLWEPFLPRACRKYQHPRRVRAGMVPWVTGACALVDRRVFEAVSGMDEDFFLYYEEVALCRSARRLGYGVEFDPSVEVVHLRPLQNRAVPPALRVVTRHSRLLFFQRHQPAWQFPVLAGLTRLEALIRGGWARLQGRRSEQDAWTLVRKMTRAMERGGHFTGREIRDLASRVAARREPRDATRAETASTHQPLHGSARRGRKARMGGPR